ncbi:DNA-processing protein DprA, partial [Limnobacter sp.]|uniref:DNA-processing protein DprA n=1 Tax=Limnobacter sp. TaxID=2003368 RepID=UPI00273383B3
MAIGCDGLAHQAALDCGAHTVAVMAHGLHMTAPSKHKSLAQAILASGGALVSEYPFGQAVQSQQYVKRDRTQAGMALGVVMIQSDLKGGSLYASRATLEYGRWLAVPYPTPRDMEKREPKVQANLVIAEAVPHERADLLRCTVSALERVIVLRNKEDYWRLAESDGVEPFTRGKSSVGQVDDIETDEHGAASDATGDFFSQPLPQPETLPADEAASAEPAAPFDDPIATEGETPDQPSVPDSSRIEDVEAPPSGAVPREVVAAFEPSDVPSAQETAPVDALTAADRAEPASIESVAALASAEAAETVEVALAPVPKAVEPTRRVQLDVSLPKDEEVGAAFGLWLPPKIGSKAF